MFKNFKELAEAYMQNNRFLKYGKLVIKDIRDGKEIGFGEKEVLDKNRYILPQEDADKALAKLEQVKASTTDPAKIAKAQTKYAKAHEKAVKKAAKAEKLQKKL